LKKFYFIFEKKPFVHPSPPLFAPFNIILCFVFGGKFLQIDDSFWGNSFKLMRIQGKILRKSIIIFF